MPATPLPPDGQKPSNVTADLDNDEDNQLEPGLVQDLDNGEDNQLEPGMVVPSSSSREDTHGISCTEDATHGSSQDYDDLENVVGEQKPELPTGFQSVHTAEAQVNEKKNPGCSCEWEKIKEKDGIIWEVEKNKKKNIDFGKNIKKDTLYKLVAFVETLKLLKLHPMSNFDKLSSCPIESFVSMITENHSESKVEEIVETIWRKYTDLSEKKDSLIVGVCVCLLASKLHESPLVVAETLKHQPSHQKSFEERVDTNLKVAMVVNGETIYHKDLACLDEHEWVSDKVVDLFLKLLKIDNPKPSVFIFPTEIAWQWLVRKEDKDLYTKVEFLRNDIIFIPILDKSHWILMVVYLKKRAVEVYDSLGNDNTEYYQLWIKFIQERNKVCDEKLEKWSYRDGNSSPQYDNDSCGVFLMMNAEAVMKKVPPQIMRQVHCRMYREYVKKYIVSAGMSESKGVKLREENDGPEF